MHGMFAPTVIRRSQLQLQHFRWRVHGKPAALAASSLSAAQVRTVIEGRVTAVGGNGEVLNRAFSAVRVLPSLVGRRETVMPQILQALTTGASSHAYYLRRVEQLKDSIISSNNAKCDRSRGKPFLESV